MNKSAFYEFNLKEVLESSKSILEQSISKKPYKFIIAFSGGDDSLTVFHLLLHFGFKVDAAIFADTKTGFPQTPIIIFLN